MDMYNPNNIMFAFNSPWTRLNCHPIMDSTYVLLVSVAAYVITVVKDILGSVWTFVYFESHCLTRVE